MSDPVAAIGAVSAVSAQSHTQSSASMSGVSSGREMSVTPTPASHDVASFQAMVQAPSSESGASSVGSKLVDAGVNLSNRYADRLGSARELASISPEELGVDHSDYMRAMLAVQVSLSEVTVELQSTAQIANSVKDSFNGLYRMQG
jgi:hypothetical protein